MSLLKRFLILFLTSLDLMIVCVILYLISSLISFNVQFSLIMARFASRSETVETSTMIMITVLAFKDLLFWVLLIYFLQNSGLIRKCGALLKRGWRAMRTRLGLRIVDSDSKPDFAVVQVGRVEQLKAMDSILDRFNKCTLAARPRFSLQMSEDRRPTVEYVKMILLELLILMELVAFDSSRRRSAGPRSEKTLP